MGAAEFEIGSQAKSLKRMFEGEIEIGKCAIYVFDRFVEFYLVAHKGFYFEAYGAVILGMIHQDWRMQEPTYLRYILEKKFRLPLTDKYSDVETKAWFDFGNDVLFTLSQRDANFLVAALANTKEIWRKKDEWLNSPPVKKFQKEFEKIKKRLEKQGKRWIYLDGVEDRDGELMVWLNPATSEGIGFVSLQDLRDWLKGKGKIAESYKKTERQQDA